MVIEETLQDFKLLLYGISAGVAIILLAIYGIRMKLTSSPEERKEAKRAMFHIILGLFLIIVAVGVVELVYKIPSKPANPEIIDARAWSLTNPFIPEDKQTALEFNFKNTLTENLTGVVVEVSSFKHDWCDEDLFQYIFPKLGIVYSETTIPYSHNNFCENSTRFSIKVKADQNWWSFCINCPPTLGNCDTTFGEC